MPCHCHMPQCPLQTMGQPLFSHNREAGLLVMEPRPQPLYPCSSKNGGSTTVKSRPADCSLSTSTSPKTKAGGRTPPRKPCFTAFSRLRSRHKATAASDTILEVSVYLEQWSVAEGLHEQGHANHTSLWPALWGSCVQISGLGNRPNMATNPSRSAVQRCSSGPPWHPQPPRPRDSAPRVPAAESRHEPFAGLSLGDKLDAEETSFSLLRGGTLPWSGEPSGAAHFLSFSNGWTTHG